MLALLLAVVALCVALIVTGATMAPPDDAPITTATQTLGIALLVAGIVRRNGQTVIPSGNDALQEGDDVVIVTTDTTLHSLRDIVK